MRLKQYKKNTGNGFRHGDLFDSGRTRRRPEIIRYGMILLVIAAVSRVFIPANSVSAQAPSPVIESVFARGMTLRDFTELLTRGFGAEWKVLVSEKAGDRKIRFFMADAGVEETLQALCTSYGLWYRRSSDSGIIQIMTLEEYRESINLYADELVEVVPVLYPSPEEIGDSLARLFQDRVVWDPPSEDVGNDITRIEDALDRMDTIANRATLVDTEGESWTSGSSSTDRYERQSYSNWRTDRYGRRTYDDRDRGASDTHSVDDVVSSREQEMAVRQKEVSPLEFFEKERASRPGLVYVSAAPMANALVLRSSDAKSLKLVKRVINELDKPKPQVLLEVKVLEITLSDEQARGVDWLFRKERGDDIISGGMSRGITSTPGDLIESSDITTLVMQGEGLDPMAAVFNVVSDNVRARLQLLQEENRVKALATPTLLVSDNEASRIFIGSEVTVLEKVETTTTTTTTSTTTEKEGNTSVTAPRKRIGTTLLITPKIHADRTVTIRILQETTALGDERSVSYGSSDEDGGFLSQDVEETSVTTTVMASDGHTIAIGGLIQEEHGYQESGIPGLMHIPVLGNLFKKTVKSKTRTELLVLIQPRVLLAPGEADSASRAFIEKASRHSDILLPSPHAEDERQEPNAP